MLSAASLRSLMEADGSPDRLLRHLFDRTRYLFVYGFRPTASDVSTVRHLSGGLVNAVVGFPPGNHQYAISSDWRPLTREFTGLAFGPIQTWLDFGFSGPPRVPALRPIISIGGAPSFAAFTVDGCTVFILACGDIVDLDAKVQGQFRVVDWFSRVIPASMFIQHAFGRHCWQRPQPSATFIIDDPLLTENYGFLNYRQLLRALGDQRFSATIAFIPFNYRRSQASVVDFFRSRPDRLSLCIHGCDHTGGEFATADLSALSAMARLADDRMKAQEKTTGLGYDKIMVFPQGRFSAAALKALRCNDFVAAVNTSPISEDSSPGDELIVREWLDVAMTRYHGFPLFVRRYQGPVADFAFDLFLGKPLLIVAHHTDFKNGYRELAAFVGALNVLNTDLKWGGLRNTLSLAYLRRDLSDDTVCARIWTNYHVIRDDATGPKRCVIVKVEPAESPPIRQVSIDGSSVEFLVDEGFLKVAIDVEPGISRVVQVAYTNDLPALDRRMGLRDRLAIQGRRRLSEFRDNYLHKHGRLLKLPGLAVRRLSR
jgi:hypothetical protein